MPGPRGSVQPVTFIMANVAPDGVDVVTDTLSYDDAGRTFSRTSKCTAFPHLDAVIVSHGPCGFSCSWRYLVELNEIRTDDATIDDLDDLADVAAVALPEMWEQMAGDYPSATVLHAGYSPRHGRHVAYRHQSPGFAVDVLDDAFLLRPQPENPPTERPATFDEFVAIALDVAEQNQPGRGYWVPIGGELCHSHVERGLVYQRRIHVFEDRTEAWAAR